MSVNLLTDKAREIEALLDEVLPPVSTRPAPIHEAMRYAVLGGENGCGRSGRRRL